MFGLTFVIEPKLAALGIHKWRTAAGHTYYVNKFSGKLILEDDVVA